MTDTHTLEAARRHVALAAEYKGLTASQADALLSHFDICARSTETGSVAFLDLRGQPLLDEANGYQPADTAGFLRYTAKVSPSLLEPTATETKPAAPAAAPSTAAAAMAAVKSGSLSVQDATAALLAQSAPPAASPQPGGPLNFTTLMQAARAGDNAALERLKSVVHTK